jgi:hypothetical protein
MQICAESKFIVNVFSIVCFLLKCKAIVYWGVYVHRKTTDGPSKMLPRVPLYEGVEGPCDAQ